MNDFPFDTIGFDLDGTLVDTSGDLTCAVNHALGLAGRPSLTQDQVKPMIGLGAKHMLEQGLLATGGVEEAAFKPLYRDLLRFYEANISAHSCHFPGGVAMLDALEARGVKLAVVTNKFEKLAVKLLDEMGLLPRLVTVIGADTLGPGNSKPSPAPIVEMISRCGGGPDAARRTAFIGDSIYDVMAAKAAGVPAIAVSFGFLHQPVAELGADAVIDHWDELVPLLERMGQA